MANRTQQDSATGFDELLYQNLQQIADGPVNPETGKRDSVSSALVTRWAQVYVIRPDDKTPVAQGPTAVRSRVGEQQ